MRSSSSSVFLSVAIALVTTSALSAEPREPDRHPLRALECVSATISTANLEFRATGLEPAWTLELGGGQCLTFAVPGTDVLVSAALPEPMQVMKAGGALYGVHTQAHALQIGIERRNCPGDLNGAYTTHTVSVRLNGQEYRGCGGEPSGARGD